MFNVVLFTIFSMSTSKSLMPIQVHGKDGHVLSLKGF